jgi:hypothetical protein
MKLVVIDDENTARDQKINHVIKDYLISKLKEQRVPSPLSVTKPNPRIREIKREMSEINQRLSQHEQCIAELCLSEVEIVWNRVAVLKQGMSFGELALIDRKGLRAARIVCTTKCQMGIISKDDYDKCLAKIDKRQRDHLV